MKYLLAFTILSLGLLCKESPDDAMKKQPAYDNDTKSTYQAAFLIMDGVYNTELTAPFDIFHHTKFREGIQPMHVFTIAADTQVITTFEGLSLIPDYGYSQKNHPPIDILVVPSAEGHLDRDLENEAMLDFVRETASGAQYVISLCDGAFVLAKAGLLDTIASTTFPGDLDRYAQMFPHLDIRKDVHLVHDGKYITSAGGARSFDAALYLCEVLYGKAIARQLAKGLVIDWDMEEVSKAVEQ